MRRLGKESAAVRLEWRPEDQAHERPETSIRIKTIRINRYFNGLLMEEHEKLSNRQPKFQQLTVSSQ